MRQPVQAGNVAWAVEEELLEEETTPKKWMKKIKVGEPAYRRLEGALPPPKSEREYTAPVDGAC